MWVIKYLYSRMLLFIEFFFGIDKAKQFDTKLRFHKDLNLHEPKTLSDKVAYLELHSQSDIAVKCTDKYAVREYITRKNLSNILIPVVGGPWKNQKDIRFDELPDKFVIKATHGCKMNYIVKDKTRLDEENCKKVLGKWLRITYGTYSVEPHYKKIPHRLYAEYYLDTMGDLVDYKIHCFNGVPEFVLTCSNRKTSKDGAMEVTLDLYDMKWNHLPAIINVGLEKAGRGEIKKPKTFDEMVRIAEILSSEIPFVRIDLYEYRGKVLFGEMTFSPGCCVFPYFSKEFDAEMGKRLKI